MKAYRVIGTILSILLAVIFSVEIFALTALHATARVVNKQTISAITEAFLDNEELYGEVTENISKEISVSITTSISENLFDFGITLNEEAVEQAVNEILNSDAVKDVISDAASDLVMDMMDPKSEGITIDITEKFSDMFDGDSETFNDILEDFAANSGVTYDSIYNAASSYMTQAGIEAPEYGASYAEILADALDANNQMLDNLIDGYLASMGFSRSDLPDMPDTDYAPTDPDAEAEAAIAEMQALMKEVGIVVDFLKSPVYILIICGTLLLFFGISALLTWSVKRSLLISGIMTAISAIMLFIMGSIKFPTALLLPILEESFGTAAITAHDILAIAWGSATSNITVCGLIALATSFLLIGGFILWYTLAKKKKSITTI